MLGQVKIKGKSNEITSVPIRLELLDITDSVETPLFDSLLTSEQLAFFNSFYPLGRSGQAQDITEAVLFLASDRL